MLNLIAKDLKILLGRGQGKQQALRLVLVIVAIAFLVYMETYVYREILGHLMTYEGAPISFTAVFLFILSMIMILSAMAQSEKLFFNASEAREMAPYPVSNAKIISSKLLLLFLTQFVLNFVFAFPVLVSYGVMNTRMPLFYFLCVFYPVFAFFFEAGIGLALSYPYHRLKLFLNSKPLVQFIVAVVLMGVLSYFYGVVLSAFLDVIVGEGINSLFTTDNMAALNEAKRFLVVANYLTDFFTSNSLSALLRWLMFSLPAFGLGLGLIIPLFQLGQGYGKSTKKEASFDEKVISPKKALFKKEFALLFRDSDNLFSYSGLLIVGPYLCYLIVLAMNKLLTTGAVAYYLVMFQGITFYVDVFVILCFSALVASGGADFISREKSAVKALKMMPVSYWTQMIIKASIPVIASSVSLLATIIVCWASGQVNAAIAMTSLFGGLLFLFGFNLLSFIEEMRRKVGANVNHFLSGAFTYAVPLLFLLIAIGLSFLRLSSGLIFLIGFAGILLLVLPVIIYFFSKKRVLWDEMEVSN